MKSFDLTFNQASNIIRKYAPKTAQYYDKEGWWYFGISGYDEARKLTKEHNITEEELKRLN